MCKHPPLDIACSPRAASALCDPAHRPIHSAQHPALLQVLSENGFLYDSSLIEEPTQSISNGMSARTFPYTMQDGIPQNCAWCAGTR